MDYDTVLPLICRDRPSHLNALNLTIENSSVHGRGLIDIWHPAWMPAHPDLAPAEVASFYRDIRPFVSHCRYPDCTHAHEEDCAVKDAVADDLIDARRYESYRHLCEGVLE